MSKKTCKTFNNQKDSDLYQFIEETRKLINLSVKLDAPSDVLTEAREQLVKLTDSLTAYSGKRALPQFYPDYPADDPNSFLPYSPFSGRFNPLAPPVEYVIEGDKLIGNITLNTAYEGPPNGVHGGIISGIYDQLLSVLSVTKNLGGPTAYLNVSYIKPTPLNVPLRFEAWIENIEDKKILIKGACYCDGEEVTQCEGLFIHYIPS